LSAGSTWQQQPGQQRAGGLTLGLSAGLLQTLHLLAGQVCYCSSADPSAALGLWSCRVRPTLILTGVGAWCRPQPLGGATPCSLSALTVPTTLRAGLPSSAQTWQRRGSGGPRAHSWWGTGTLCQPLSRTAGVNQRSRGTHMGMPARWQPCAPRPRVLWTCGG